MIKRTAGWLTLFVVGTDLFVISPLLPDVRHSLSVSTSAAGWAVTAFSLAYLVGGPSLGALADRTGHRRVLVGALLTFAAANLLTGLAGTLTVLLVARAVAGLAASGITPSVYALISASAPPAQRASWLAVVTSGLLLALATGAPAGSLLAAAVGWHGVFLLLALAALIVLVPVLRTPAHGPAPAAAPQPAGASSPSAGASSPSATPAPTSPAAGPPAGLPARLRAVSVTALWALAVYGLYTYLGTVLTDTRLLRAGAVAVALVCYGIGAVTGNLAGGRLTDRYGGRRVSLVSLLALAGTEVAFGLVLHAPAGLLYVVLGAFALAAYPYFAAQQARLVARFSTAAGSLLAWNNSAMYAGILLGSVLGGPLLGAAGARVLAFSGGATAVLAAVTSTVSIGRVREQKTTAGRAVG